MEEISLINQSKTTFKGCDNIQKIVIGQGDDYKIICQFIPLSKNIIKLTAADLSKQQKLDADPKTIQQLNFTGNLGRDGNTIFFIIKETKETVLDFSKGKVQVLWFYFVLL